MTLDELVTEALSFSPPGEPAAASMDVSKNPESIKDIPGASILVIGIGTAGAKIVDRLHQLAGPGLRVLTLDSDRESLEKSPATSRFFLKHSCFSRGFGLCGGDPDLVDYYHEATKTASPDIEPLLGNPEFCFIVAGLGGNMGTGAAPVIARMMRQRGAVVTVIVTRPFTFEHQRKLRAARGIRELSQAANTVLVLDFEKLKSVLPKEMVLPQQYAVMDHIMALSVLNFWEGTKFNAFFAFTLEDLHYMLERGGTGTLLLGEFDEDAGKRISLDEMRVPLLDFTHEAAKGGIIHITGGYDLGLFESDQIVTGMSMVFNPHADVIWSATVRKEMEGKLRLFTIVTGLNYGRRVHQKSLEEWLDEP
jgi:cell division protein FtsZ